MPVLAAALSALSAYAVLFAANLRLLHYQRSSVVPQVNAWFDGTACLAGLAAVLTATVVPALTAAGSAPPPRWPGPCVPPWSSCWWRSPRQLRARGARQRRRPLAVLALFVLLLLAEVADLAHLVLGTDGATARRAAGPGAAGLRLLALPLLVRTLRTRRRRPAWSPTSAGRRWPPRSPSSS